MGFLQRLGALFNGGHDEPKPRVRSAFDAAGGGRLASDWTSAILSADSASHGARRVVRARSQDQARNSGIMQRYYSVGKSNIIGPNGIGLQMKIKDPPDANGMQRLDTFANNYIEREWELAGRKGNYDVTGRHSRQSFEELAWESSDRDGDGFIRIVRGFPNRWAIAYQFIESEYIDEEFTERRNRYGNEIRMGIEYDANRRPVAYHMLAKHPGDTFGASSYVYDGKRIRIPANEIIHIDYNRKRAEETRPMPIATPIMEEVQMLKGFEEAVLVAARVGACQMGFFSSKPGDEYTGPTDHEGNIIRNSEPGQFEDIGEKTFQAFNPTQPTDAYAPFVKERILRIATGLNVSSYTLSGDLSSFSYSSARVGMLAERDYWKWRQKSFIETVRTPCFEAWLSQSMLSGAIALPFTKFDKFNAPDWKPRRWEWVDPKNDIEAAILQIEKGLGTRSRFIGEAGGDFEEVMDELAMEQQYIADKNLSFADANKAAAAPAVVDADGNAVTSTE